MKRLIKYLKRTLKKKPNVIVTYYGDTDSSDEPQLSLGWYKHFVKHPYKGFSVRVAVFRMVLDVTFVDNYAGYLRIFKDDSRRSGVWTLFR